MAIPSVRYRLTGENTYLTDLEVDAEFALNFRPSSDLTEENVDSILEAIGAEKIDRTNSLCSDRGFIKYRRFILIRENGASMTLVAPRREKIISQRDAIQAVFQNITPKLVCIKLEGEEVSNILPEFDTSNRTGATILTPIEPPENSAKNRFFYSGSMREYKSDAGFGSSITLPFKMSSNQDQQAYSALETQINNCLGNLINASVCGGSSNSRTARRIVLSVNTGSEGLVGPPAPGEDSLSNIQSLTIPISENTPQSIKTCIQQYAQLNAVQCISYYGESNNRLHRVVSSTTEG